MSRRLSDGGRTYFKESKLWKFVKSDVLGCSLLAVDIALAGVALYVVLSQPDYNIYRTPIKIETPRDQYIEPIAYDLTQRQR